jgi:hypothetical protein
VSYRGEVRVEKPPRQPQPNQPPPKRKRPYEPPRVLTDEAFEQLSLACSTKIGTKKNFT